MDINEVKHIFTNHPPKTAEIGYRLDGLTERFIELGEVLSTLPDSREADNAMSKLEECSMWAKAAIARNQ